MNCGVYRLYGDNDVLLYVGCSVNPVSRFKMHKRRWWGSQVRRHEIDWYPDIRLAREAEKEAICVLRPRYNKTYNKHKARYSSKGGWGGIADYPNPTLPPGWNRKKA